MRKALCTSLIMLLLGLTACSSSEEESDRTPFPGSETSQERLNAEDLKEEEINKKETEDLKGTGSAKGTGDVETTEGAELPVIQPGETAAEKSKYTDQNGDVAIIPADCTVSAREDEQTICSGLVVIGPDESEFVWIPTTQTSLAVRDFGSYFSGGSISGYYDETELESYQEMVESTELYGGFYMGRFEASYGSGNNVSDYIPASKPVTGDVPGRIWVQFSP